MSGSVEEPPTYVPIEVVGRRLSLAITTLRQWVKTGVIPSDTYIKVGQTYRFNLPAVVHALSSAEDTPKNVTLEQIPEVSRTIDPDEDM